MMAAEGEAGESSDAKSKVLDLIKRFVFGHQIKNYVCVLGSIDSLPAIISMATRSLPPEQLNEIYSSVSDLEVIGENQEYTWCTCNLASSIRSRKLNLIYPATEVHIAKMSEISYVAFEETPEIYSNVTEPIINQIDPSLIEWIVNIIEDRSHSEEVIMRSEPNPPYGTGYCIVPDYKWDKKYVEDLYLLITACDRNLRSLRDLNSSHIPMLKSMAESTDLICKKYPGVRKEDLTMFVHYLPSYWIFHVHVAHIRNTINAANPLRCHSLSQVISNLSICPDYYKNINLMCTVDDKGDLYKAFKSYSKVDPM